jgi:hypothetical protein
LTSVCYPEVRQQTRLKVRAKQRLTTKSIE